MNYLKLHGFSPAIFCLCAIRVIQNSALFKRLAPCDILLLTPRTTKSPGLKIIFATSKYDNSPKGAIVGFTRFNGKPLTFSSPTTTDGTAS